MGEMLKIDVMIGDELKREQIRKQIEGFLTEMGIDFSFENDMIKMIVVKCFKGSKNKKFFRAEIEIDNIVQLLADGKICHICTQSGEDYATKKTMSYFLEKLPKHFIQIRKQHVINLKHVVRFEKPTVYSKP